jgi:glycerol dehydrogenase-like iron-containing ADH family enzyme
MSRRRSRQQRARAVRRAEERQRDLVVVAAAVEGFDHSHPALLAEHIASDSPLVSEPLRPHVLTHDESGESDE